MLIDYLDHNKVCWVLNLLLYKGTVDYYIHTVKLYYVTRISILCIMLQILIMVFYQLTVYILLLIIVLSLTITVLQLKTAANSERIMLLFVFLKSQKIGKICGECQNIYDLVNF